MRSGPTVNGFGALRWVGALRVQMEHSPRVPTPESERLESRGKRTVCRCLSLRAAASASAMAPLATATRLLTCLPCESPSNGIAAVAVSIAAMSSSGRDVLVSSNTSSNSTSWMRQGGALVAVRACDSAHCRYGSGSIRKRGA